MTLPRWLVFIIGTMVGALITKYEKDIREVIA